MSLPEVLLWRELKLRPGGFKFRKQCPQDRYVLDFACLEARLGIEVDGEAHDRGDRPERDRKRDDYLKSVGFTTMRIPAREVLGNLEGVLIGIVEQCRSLVSPPRNGEVARRSRDGGVDGLMIEARPLHQPLAGPPPRSGEDSA